MYKVVVNRFGGVEALEVVEGRDPVPQSWQVVVKLTSIGMNHAELMQRQGAYKASSGEPPFSPGLEGGGVIVAVGDQVTQRRVGQRVALTLDAPRLAFGGQGTYQSHYVTDWFRTVEAPDGVPDVLLGALWLAYLTAWGALLWRGDLQIGQTVLIPAASSSVGIAASQIVSDYGGIPIGTTTSPRKVEALKRMDEARFAHLVCTADQGWTKQVKEITDGRGVNVIFDPVAAGAFLDSEIRLLAAGGTIWVYGLLGEVGPVNVAPLVIKRGVMRGWLNNELAEDAATCAAAYRDIFNAIATGRYRMPIAGTFNLRDVRQAHEVMERGEHIGKFVLVP